jgi:fucose 4-O-acetylase-like acetyltransferase
MTTRNATVDIAKGLGITLVALGHNELVDCDKGEVFRVVFSFHMPLFFLLSGAFMRAKDSVGSLLRARATRLLLPWLGVLAFLAVWHFGVLRADGLSRNLERTARLIYGNGPWFEGSAFPFGPTWFLPHLVLASVVALVLLKLLTKHARLASSGILLLSLLLLAAGLFLIDVFFPVQIPLFGSAPGLPWSMDLLPVSLAFLLLGHALRDHLTKFTFRWAAFCVAGLVFAICHWQFDETMDLNLRQVGHPLIVFIQVFTGLYLCMSVAALLSRTKWTGQFFAYLGSATLTLLLLHEAVQQKVFYSLIDRTPHPSIAGVLSFLSSIAVPLILWEGAKRIGPRFAALSSKSRPAASLD